MNAISRPSETLLGRSTFALAEALADPDLSEGWIQEAAAALLTHTAVELLVLEQRAGRSLSLQEAVAFLCRGAEGRE